MAYQDDPNQKPRKQKQDLPDPPDIGDEPDGLPDYEDPPEPTHPQDPVPPVIRSNNYPFDPNNTLNYIRDPEDSNRNYRLRRGLGIVDQQR